MIKYKNECVGCRDIGLPCMGETCSNRQVPRHYCDGCGEEEKLWHFNEGEFCQDCILDMIWDVLEVVNGTE